MLIAHTLQYLYLRYRKELLVNYYSSSIHWTCDVDWYKCYLYELKRTIVYHFALLPDSLNYFLNFTLFESPLSKESSSHSFSSSVILGMSCHVIVLIFHRFWMQNNVPIYSASSPMVQWIMIDWLVCFDNR